MVHGMRLSATSKRPDPRKNAPAEVPAALQQSPEDCRGLFVIGTDTGAGKTYVAALIAASIRAEGYRVGVYKPAASGCNKSGRTLVSEDAQRLWNAAGKPGSLSAVCPQRFAAPLSPHLAALEEHKELDQKKLRTGLTYWTRRSEFVVVEGAGGLLSPMGPTQYVADLVREFGFPIVVVAPNRVGVINQTLQTLLAASSLCDKIPIAGVVLTDVFPPEHFDPSMPGNRAELELRCVPPVLAHVEHGAKRFARDLRWSNFAARSIHGAAPTH